MKLYKAVPCRNCNTGDLGDRDHERGQDCVNCFGTGVEYLSLSPADLAAAGLAGWAVWRDVISWLSCKIKFHWAQSEKKTIAPATSIEIIRVLRFMTELESAHSAVLDKYREVIKKAGAWPDLYAWLGSQPKKIRLLDVVQKVDELLARSDERPSGRAEVERQEGEEKDARTT